MRRSRRTMPDESPAVSRPRSWTRCRCTRCQMMVMGWALPMVLLMARQMARRLAKACQLSRRECRGVRGGDVFGNEQDAKGG